MKKIIVFIITLLSLNGLFAQDCKCPKNDYTNDLKPYSIYDLGEGNKIALCGYVNDDDTFSEFVLTDCNFKTIINFWGALETCNVEQDEDTLVVKEFAFLPIENDEYQIVVWRIYKYWYNIKNQIQQKTYLNPDFPKYSQKQIDGFIKQYETSDNKLNDNCIVLANKLFVSAISGSQKAKQCFLDFPKKFKGLDGALSEEYHDLESMLSAWEREK